MTSGKKVKNLDNEIAILENQQRMVSKLCFHPFENYLFVSNDHDGISIWNWEEGFQVSKFSNGNPSNSRISSLTVINDHLNPLLCVGSDEGVIRIWTSTGVSDGQQKLITAWRALDEMIPLKGHHAGMVVDWCKKKDLLIVSGRVDHLKIWDLNKELAVQEVPTESQTCVTCLCSDKNETNCIVAGFGDGTVRIFDRRTSSKYAAVTIFSEHKSWVVNTCMPRILNKQIISGAYNGDVKIWDLRNPKSSTKTIIAHTVPSVSALTVHDFFPIFAIGTQDQRVKVINFHGEEVSIIRYHDGFLGQRIGPVSAMAFHPYKMKLSAGCTDSIVSIYTGETARELLIKPDFIDGLW